MRILAWLLRVLGFITLTAIFAVFMPRSWMERGAELTGVAPYPDSVLTDYLARSASALYALVGALVVYISFHVHRYLDLIAVMGRLTVVLGVLLIWIDFSIGMPASWSWGEGPPTIALGFLLTWLARRAQSEAAT